MLRYAKLTAGWVSMMLCTALILPAQNASNDDLRKEIRALSETVKAIQKDLQDIKVLLAGRTPVNPPQKIPLDLGNNPIKGEASARLTLVEFSDYQCSYCSRHVRDTAPLIEKEYIATGKLRHVFMDFPLESIHKLAFNSAVAAGCAGEQSKFWEMHDRLFAEQKTLESWTEHAKVIGLDLPRFEECMSSGRQTAEIRKDQAEADKAGVSSTPAFFLAYTDPKSSKVKTEVRLTGAQPFAVFKAAIEKLLSVPQAPVKKQ